MHTLALAALLGCPKDEPQAPPPASVIVSDAAVIVDAATADALTSLSAD